MALLLAFAASAKAETADHAAAAVEQAAATVDDAAAAVQSAAPPTAPTAPVGVPEPVETAPSPPAVSPEPDLTANLPETPVADGLASQVQREPAAAVPSTAQVMKSAGTIRKDVEEVAASVKHSAETAAQSVDRATSIDRVHALAHHPLRVAGETLRDVSGSLVAEQTTESLLPPPGRPPETGVGPAGLLPPTAAPRLPGDPGDLLAATHPLQRVSVLERPSTGYRGESGGFQLLRAESSHDVAGNAEDMTPRASADATFLSLGKADEHFENRAPLEPLDRDNPSPLPGSPQAAASGSGGSSFVPIAALLALLALVVPAILRRLREAPDLRASSLFVCALERPG